MTNNHIPVLYVVEFLFNHIGWILPLTGMVAMGTILCGCEAEPSREELEYRQEMQEDLHGTLRNVEYITTECVVLTFEDGRVTRRYLKHKSITFHVGRYQHIELDNGSIVKVDCPEYNRQDAVQQVPVPETQTVHLPKGRGD